MRPVAVIGVGKTPFGAFADKDLRSLAVAASLEALHNGGVDRKQIEAFYLGNFAGPSFVGQSHLAPFVAGAMDMTGIPCTRIEAACASSGSAFFHAVSSVGAGLYDIVMVTGVEKMTSQDTPRVAEILAMAGDCGSEGKAGATFPALFAMVARRHMHQYGTQKQHLAAVAVKNHANGAKNPGAHLKKIITMEQAMAGKPIADPLNIYDCSLVSDGAASVIVCPLDQVKEFTRKPVQVIGIAQTSDYVPLDRKDDITTFRSVRCAAEKAYAMAGLGPKEIDLAEVHDCFTIAEIVAIEDIGFVSSGRGGFYTAEGATALDGERPVNTSGGLKAKGHPVGATGVAQICDVVMQIRGEAGDRQVRKHEVGLAQNLGGSGASCVVTILAAA